MKKNFITGLISGLCGAVLIFAVVGAALILIDDKSKDNDDTQIEAQEETQKSVEEQPYDKIVEKLSFLEMLVDNYYLESVDPNVFADGIYKGFVSSLEDPYSTYYTEEEYKALMESSSGVYCGIGATVSQDVKTGIITIVKPFKNGPASGAGILPGDVIYKVETEEVTGEDLSEVVSKMKGVEGTKVQITIVREGETDPLEFTITRQEIEVPTIEYQMLKDDIGYILISEFDEITVTQFISAVDELEKSGMKALVVDVRNNPGGLLDSVVKMLDRLLPKGLIVYTEDKYGTREEENAVDSKKLKVPMAVLINGNSASASEIFAGAVQDYDIGTLVGTTSFGKGIVQKVIPLSDGTAVKLTISKYFTPKGRNIHGTGIVPDVEVELAEELKKEISIPLDKDNQLQEAIKILKKQLKK
jgi:carboxyl-terminal processing protease